MADHPGLLWFDVTAHHPATAYGGHHYITDAMAYPVDHLRPEPTLLDGLGAGQYERVAGERAAPGGQDLGDIRITLGVDVPGADVAGDQPDAGQQVRFGVGVDDPVPRQSDHPVICDHGEHGTRRQGRDEVADQQIDLP